MLSEKQKTLKIIKGFKFRFHKMLQGEVQRWTCCKNSCKCFFKLTSDNVMSEIFNEHRHDKCDENVLTRQKISNAVKRKAVDDISVRPSKILHNEFKNGDISTLTTNDVILIKQNIHHARSLLHPKLPKSTHETQNALKSMNIITNNDENFMFLNDFENSIIGFSTKINLDVLCDVKNIYIDGTFKSCPKYFTQIFTIHGYYKDSYVPLVFLLLPTKESNIYVKAFQHIINYCTSLSLTFSPSEIYVDFEIGIHNAIKEVWTDVRIKGCRFHLGQSWWRTIQKLGLSKEYKSDSEKSRYLKYFFGLSFLNENDVVQCFTEDLMAIKPCDDEKIDSFTDYILNNYVDNDVAQFPPKVWSDFSATTNRTTNSCESFHAKLNAFFHSGHPNIFILVDTLLGIQSDTYIKLRSKAKRPCKKTLEKENVLREQTNKYINMQIGRFDFLKSVSFKFLPATI